jgi:FdhD protein
MSLANALRAKPITRIEGAGVAPQVSDDWVAVEEPLEIRVGGVSVAVVMRTPGNDRELAAGFLVSEGIVRRRDDVLDLVRCDATGAGVNSGAGATARAREDAGATESENAKSENIMNVILAPGAAVDLARLTRHVFTSSSCGICSRATIDAVRGQFPPIAGVGAEQGVAAFAPSRALLASLPEMLRSGQEGFAATGGLHASALFDAEGRLELLREDVGRHNALDKVIGHAFLAERLPLEGRILLVSGRVSFELMQKALAAGIPCVAAISAPTTAAVEFARETGQTLVGFLRGERMNVYAGTLAE